MLVQPSRTATVCEVDRARKRAASCNRAQNLGYRTNKLEICHCRSEPILLTLLRLHSRYGPPNRSAALRRPLSRGSSPSGYPAEPLVRYQINRQLSGWNLPPLVIRAFGAHCQNRTSYAPEYRRASTRTQECRWTEAMRWATRSIDRRQQEIGPAPPPRQGGKITLSRCRQSCDAYSMPMPYLAIIVLLFRYRGRLMMQLPDVG